VGRPHSRQRAIGALIGAVIDHADSGERDTN